MDDVVILEGDGIGPEIMREVLRILDAAGAKLRRHAFDIGQRALEKRGELIPAETLEALDEFKVALKGPVATPVGGGFRSVNVSLRLKYDLYANLRPARSVPGISRYEGVDIITVRENTEDLYMGEEREIAGGCEAIKRITRNASERIAVFAFDHARKMGRKKITCVHKANILKKTDGLFLSTFRQVGANYPDIIADDKIVDNMCMQLVTDPRQFDILLAPNLYGDIISDLVSGLVGGLGLTGAANIGAGAAIFEAVHGSAPDIAGRGIANPLALLRAACMMLDHLGQTDAARRIESAADAALESKKVLTADLGGAATTRQFADAIVSALEA